ncbi:hypothetical protein BN8_05140 [Fibrisoma limi BUZ 3]|uniref:Uncharacterized protein n=1 Tax=Fibrisoma limi BUZ 3 TaxID=1185876 RepID=I2GPM1_9BACT|nr:hypothetical protein [Fibrisoma limi]CCH55849.1 hypothetical protein BN8_05140 [Fibrisoma limi BUZ 3]
MNLSLIAPASGFVPDALAHHFLPDPEPAIADIQRFRGRIYAQDSAIPLSALDSLGRHRSEVDYRSWHIVARDAQGQISGVLRLPIYPIDTPIESLLLNQTLERMQPEQRHLYRYVLQRFIDRSVTAGYPCVAEPGGWAVDRTRCGRQTGINLVTTGWAIGEYYGHYVAASTVTVKHHAADLLKLMGGFNELAGTPNARFHDPYFRCDIELVFFYSDKVSGRFGEMVEKIKEDLLKSQSFVTL